MLIEKPSPGPLAPGEGDKRRSLIKLRYPVTASNPNHARNRLIVLLIFMVSIIPFGVAWYLAKHTALVKQRPMTNYGHLIAPARPLDYAELLQTPISKAEDLQAIKGRWVVVQIAVQAACGEACQQTAAKTARMRLMLNKEISRVRRLLLLSAATDAAVTQTLAERDPTLQMGSASDALRQQLQDAIGAPLVDGSLLLLDPLGNAMMWYAPDFDVYGVLRDLQRLLKNSQIG